MADGERVVTEAPEFAVDMVLTELRRAYPEPVDKNALRDGTGLGAEDLRSALKALEEDDRAAAGEGGWTFVDPEDSGGAIGQSFLEPDLDEEEGEDLDEDSDGPEEAADAPSGVGKAVPAEVFSGVTGEAADTRYSAALILEVGYHPELKPGEEPDEAAVREASVIAQAAVAGIAREFPSLPVSVALGKVEAFDNPRRIYPT